ncbi:septum site-determining protein MinC [Alkalibacterium kapii]|uniref:Probable septum site-determining protein MinC n=1 Tax=Alkalibacterium kapii TaxID=426704 RepID=A0A511AWS1_9LACT|nr:septum site-determining protein MinC [Alkalibacterium kapii]GEK91561.1 cell division inhibitor [Alkalibacterium kapii]
MKGTVSLKGTQEGYQLIIQSSASLEDAYEELKSLTSQMRKDSHNRREIKFHVKTGLRELTDKEKNIIIEIVEDDYFKISSFESDVITREKCVRWQKEASPTLEVRTVRSGQMVEAEGDMLLIGVVHPGGIVRASGSIYIIGELKGTAHAGVNGKESAVVVANFRYNAQVRIGDNVHVIEKKDRQIDEEADTTEFVYVNDLHIIEVSKLEELKALRPELDNYAGGIYNG